MDGINELNLYRYGYNRIDEMLYSHLNRLNSIRLNQSQLTHSMLTIKLNDEMINQIVWVNCVGDTLKLDPDRHHKYLVAGPYQCCRRYRLCRR
ncbi:hypothetical protein BLOT_011033 [Blomia tropicalis]|nr:hypothetical protein BLOT_011033 [Blomia tropicalis]